MVAWHEVPGIRKKKEPVPEGRCDYVFARSLQRSCWHVLSSVMESTAAPTQSSCPSGTNRFFLRHSRHFVSGYSHQSLRDNNIHESLRVAVAPKEYFGRWSLLRWG